jgi:hypothetical protein
VPRAGWVVAVGGGGAVGGGAMGIQYPPPFFGGRGPAGPEGESLRGDV